MSSFTRSLSLAGIALVAVATARPLAAQAAGIAVGTTPPAAQVVTLEGQALVLGTMFGKKPVILEFWATWCPLCQALEPQLACDAVKAFSVPHTSYIVVVDASGRVVYTGVGKDQDMEAAVAPALTAAL